MPSNSRRALGNLDGFKFYTLHVLGKPWAMHHFIKPPEVSRLPDICDGQETMAMMNANNRHCGQG